MLRGEMDRLKEEYKTIAGSLSENLIQQGGLLMGIGEVDKGDGRPPETPARHDSTDVVDLSNSPPKPKDRKQKKKEEADALPPLPDQRRGTCSAEEFRRRLLFG